MFATAMIGAPSAYGMTLAPTVGDIATGRIRMNRTTMLRSLASRLAQGFRRRERMATQSRRRKYALEPIEPRVLLDATLDVTLFSDTVNPADDAVNLSLREAVITANETPGVDTILLGPGHYDLSIGGSGEDDAATGDLDIKESVRIIGAGSGQTTIDANGLDRVFHVQQATETRIDPVTGLEIGKKNEVVISGVTITGGQADKGGGIYNSGFLTVSDSIITGNTATFFDPLGLDTGGGGVYNQTDPAHDLNARPAGPEGLVQFINTDVSGNSPDDRLSLLGTLDGLLGVNASGLVDGFAGFFSTLEATITESIEAVGEIPLIGDQLLEAFGPILDTFVDIRANTIGEIEAILESPDPTIDGKSPAVAIQEKLALAFQELGILKDGPDAGADIGSTDVLLTMGEDARGETWIQYDAHLGKEYIYDTPTFDFGFSIGDTPLADLLPDLGLQIGADNGLRFQTGWDLRMGVGTSSLTGQDYYFVSGTTDVNDQPIEEFRAATHVFAPAPGSEGGLAEQFSDEPGLNGDGTVGLVHGTMTDGTPRRVQITAPHPLPEVLFSGQVPEGNIALQITARNASGNVIHDGVATYSMKISDNAPSVLIGLNAAIAQAFGHILTPTESPFSLTTDFSGLDRLSQPDAPKTPVLRLNARDPEIAHMQVSVNSPVPLGFLDGQVEDTRSIGLGFDNAQTSVSTAGTHRLVGASSAPVGGFIRENIDFTLWIGGPAGNTSTEKVRVFLPKAATRGIDSLESLRARLELALVDQVGQRTSFGAGTVRVEIQDDRLVLASIPAGGTAPTLAVTFRETEQTSLALLVTDDITDPDFDPALARDAAKAVDQRFFDRVTKEDVKAAQKKTDLFVPGLAAQADLRFHVNADAEHISGFVEQSLGLTNSTLGLPEIEFDLRIDGSVEWSPGVPVEKRIEAVQFDNVKVDVPSLLNNVLSPLSEAIGKVLEPIAGILGNDPGALIDRSLPVISDILNQNISLKSILQKAGDFSSEISDLLNYLNELASVNQKVAAALASQPFLEALDPEGNLTLGGIELVMNPQNPLYFPATGIPVPIDLADAGLPPSQAPPFTAFTAIDIAPGAFRVEFLHDPTNVFLMLVGQDFDIVSFNAPSVSSSAGFDYRFGYQRISFDVDASASLNAGLSMFYDSTGIRQIVEAARAENTPDFEDLLDGVYFPSGSVNPLVSMVGNFGGGGSVDIRTPEVTKRVCAGVGPARHCETITLVPEIIVFKAEGSVQGGGFLNIELEDPNHDGKLRLDEIARITNGFSNAESVIDLFNVSGSGSIDVGGNLVIVNKSFNISKMGLIGGSMSFPDLLPSKFNVQTPHNTAPRLADVLHHNGETVLRVNVGPFASDRLYGDTDDRDVVTYDADPAKNFVVTVNNAAGGLSVTVRDPSSSNSDLRSGITQTYAGTFSKILVYGTERNDTITNLTGIPAEFLGRGGNDTLVGGSGADLLVGGAGSDTLTGHGGHDTIHGGAGADSLRGGHGDDVLLGGGGADTVWGDTGRDVLEGNAGDDTIYGGAEADILRGGSGEDTLDGESGEDVIHGGSGDDILTGGHDNDTIYGDSGADTVYGGVGEDTIYGGLGDDLLSGGFNSDTIWGGAGDDTIWGNEFPDTLAGGSGDDVIFGNSDADLLDGGTGSDTLEGGGGSDSLVGGSGDDTLSGGSENDVLEGGLGADILEGGAASDILRGGRGDDELYGALAPRDEIDDLLQFQLDFDLRDQLFGESGDDLLDGYIREDFLSGGDGDDTLRGGDGADTLQGDAGNDTIEGGFDADVVRGGEGDDIIHGDVLPPEEGEDPIIVPAGDHGDQLFGDAGNDTISGDWGNDIIHGNAGDDLIHGNDGNDLLYGDDGFDRLFGDAGSDRLSGDAGADETAGGTGDDLYIWSFDTAPDVFIEADNLSDTDAISVRGSASGAADTISVSGDGVSVFVDGPGGQLVLDNIEHVTIIPGRGSDTVNLHDFTGTDVSFLAIDMEASAARFGEVDTIVYNGSNAADVIRVQETPNAITPETLPLDLIDILPASIDSILQMSDQSVGKNRDAYLINSSAATTRLEVRGYEGDDDIGVTTTHAAFDAGLLADILILGGEGDDTLRSVYDNVRVEGEAGTDRLVVTEDLKEVNGAANLSLESSNLSIGRLWQVDAIAIQPVQERIWYRGIEEIDIELGSRGPSNNVTVLSTQPGDLHFTGGSADDTYTLGATLADTTIDLVDGNNQVIVGRNGVMFNVEGSVTVSGGSGVDRVVYDNSADAASRDITITDEIIGLPTRNTIAFDDAVEALELRLGSSPDAVTVPSLTQQVIISGGGGVDHFDATLSGRPSEVAFDPGAFAVDVEHVSFTNTTSSVDDTAWRLDDVFGGSANDSRLTAGDQVALETVNAWTSHITLGDGVDRLTVLGVTHDTRVELGYGYDEVTIGEPGNGTGPAVDDVGARLTLHGGVVNEENPQADSAPNLLTVDDRANTGQGEGDRGVLARDAVTGHGLLLGFGMPGDGRIEYDDDFSVLDLTLGATDDLLTVVDTATQTFISAAGGEDGVTVLRHSHDTTVDLGADDDRITVFGLDRAIDVLGGAGSNDVLVLDRQAQTGSESGAIVDFGFDDDGNPVKIGVTGLTTVPLSFEEIEVFDLELGANDDSITIDHGVQGVLVNVIGNGGSDEVVLERIGGTGDFVGGPGVDSLTVRIEGDPALRTDFNGRMTLESELLIVDNSTFDKRVEWTASRTELKAGANTLLNTQGAEDVRVLAGKGADNLLTVEEIANIEVTATLDGNRVEMIRGARAAESGTFEAVGTEVSPVGLAGARDIALRSDGNVAYLISDGTADFLTVYERVPAGLKQIQAIGLGFTPRSIASNDDLVLIGGLQSGSAPTTSARLSVYRADGAGLLTWVSTVSPFGPTVESAGVFDMVFDAGGGILTVLYGKEDLSAKQQGIEVFAVDSATGTLTSRQFTPLKSNATSQFVRGDLEISADGTRLYVANSTPSTGDPSPASSVDTTNIQVYDRDPVTGFLTYHRGIGSDLDGIDSGIDDYTQTAVTPDGRFLYAGADARTFFPVNRTQGIIRIYELDTVRDGRILGDLGSVVLADLAPSTHGVELADMKVSEDGRKLYAFGVDSGVSFQSGHQELGVFAVFDIDPDTGALTHTQSLLHGLVGINSNHTLDLSTRHTRIPEASSIAVSEDWVLLSTSDSVHVFEVLSDGSLAFRTRADGGFGGITGVDVQSGITTAGGASISGLVAIAGADEIKRNDVGSDSDFHLVNPSIKLFRVFPNGSLVQQTTSAPGSRSVFDVTIDSEIVSPVPRPYLFGHELDGNATLSMVLPSEDTGRPGVAGSPDRILTYGLEFDASGMVSVTEASPAQTLVAESASVRIVQLEVANDEAFVLYDNGRIEAYTRSLPDSVLTLTERKAVYVDGGDLGNPDAPFGPTEIAVPADGGNVYAAMSQFIHPPNGSNAIRVFTTDNNDLSTFRSLEVVGDGDKTRDLRLARALLEVDDPDTGLRTLYVQTEDHGSSSALLQVLDPSGPADGRPTVLQTIALGTYSASDPLLKPEIAVSDDLTTVYVAVQNQSTFGQVLAFQRNADGTLSSLGSELEILNGASALAFASRDVDGDGNVDDQVLYAVGSFSNDVALFQKTAEDPLAGPDRLSETTAFRELSGIDAISINGAGNRAFAISTVDQALAVITTGSLATTHLTFGLEGVDNGLLNVQDVAASPSSSYVYTRGESAGGSGQIGVFFGGSQAQLQQTVTRSGDFTALATSPDGRNVFGAFGDTIYAFKTNSTADGRLSERGTFSGVPEGSVLTEFLATSNRLYAADASTGAILVFDYQSNVSLPLSGAFSHEIAGVGGVSDLASDASGLYLYVASDVDDTVRVISTASGDVVQTLRNNQAGIIGLKGASAVTVSQVDSFVYVTGRDSNALAIFNRDAQTGQLQPAQVFYNNNSGRLGLESPSGLAVAPDGTIHVASSEGRVAGTPGGLASFASADVGQVVEPDGFVVSFADIQGLTVATEGLADWITLVDPATHNNGLDSVSTTVTTGDGDDYVNLLRLSDETTVETGDGADLVELRSGTPDTDVEVKTGSGDDTINLRRTGPDTMTRIKGGAGEDLLTVESFNLDPSSTVADQRIKFYGEDPTDTSEDPGNTILFIAVGNSPRGALQDGAQETEAISGLIGAWIDDATPFGVLWFASTGTVDVLGAPDAEINDDNGAYHIDEGGALVLDGSTSRLFGNPATFEWDLDADGVFGEVTGALPDTLTWEELGVRFGIKDDGIYDIALRVTNDQGLSTDDFSRIVVSNTTPSISVQGPAVAEVGAAYTISFSGTDPGVDTISKWDIDWGDDTTESLSGDASTATHVYLTTGSFTPTLRATDEDGSAAESDAASPIESYKVNVPTVVVSVPTPVISTVGTASDLRIGEGEAVTFSTQAAGAPDYFWTVNGSAEIPGATNGTLTLDWTALNGYGIADDGSFDVTVRVAYGPDPTDSGSGSAVLVVDNLAPTATFTSSTEISGIPILLGDVATVQFGDQLDPSGINQADQTAGFTYSYDFTNDGSFDIVNSPDSSATIPQGFFNRSGTQTVRGRITDKDGAFTDLLTSIAVTVPEVRVNTPEFAYETLPYAIDLVTNVPTGYELTGWTIDWGDGTPIESVPADQIVATHTYADSSPIVTETLDIGDGDPFTITLPEPYLAEVTAVFGSITFDHGRVFFSVDVLNIEPTLLIGGEPTVNEGSPYTLTMSSSDPGPDTITEWLIDWGDGTVETIDGDPDAATHTYADDGVYTVSASAIDEDYIDPDAEDDPGVILAKQAVDEHGDRYRSNTFDVTVENVAPDLLLGGTGTSNEGSVYTLVLDSNDPGPDTISQWEITWGDGSAEIVSGNPSQVQHTYADDGQYTVSATATDEDGTFAAQERHTVVVGNLAPTLTVTGAPNVDEGSPFTLSFAAADPGQDTIDHWTVNWGDGATETYAGTSTSATHVYDDGTYTISVTATDEDGTFPFALIDGQTKPVPQVLTLEVANLGPTLVSFDELTRGAGATFLEGDYAVVEAVATDPGSFRDPLTYGFDLNDDGVIDFRNDSGVAFIRFTDDGPFPVTVHVSDDDGASTTGTLVLSVADAPPEVSLSGLTLVDEGATYALDLAFIDPGSDTVSGYTIDWGDGVVETFSFTGSPDLTQEHIFADGGPDLETVRSIVVSGIIDENGVHGATDSIDVTIRDVSPSIELTGDSTVAEGTPYTLTLGSVVDPGEDAVTVFRVNWGDGSTFDGNPYQTVSGPGPVLHTFAEGPRTHTISVQMLDEDGEHNGGTLDVDVTNVEPVMFGLNAPTIDENGIATLVGTFTDPGTLDEHTVVVDWGDGTEETLVVPEGDRAFTLDHRYLDDDPTGTPADTYSVTVSVVDDDPHAIPALFLTDGQSILELDADTGERVRLTDLPASSTGGPITIQAGADGVAFDGEKIYLASADNGGTVYILDADGGEFTSTTGQLLAAIAVDGEGGILYGLDAANSEIASFDIGTGSELGRIPFTTSLTSAGGLDYNTETDTLFATSASDTIAEVDPTSGEVLNVVTSPEAVSGIALQGDRLFVLGVSETLYVLDRDTGTVLSSFDLAGVLGVGGGDLFGIAGGPAVQPPVPQSISTTAVTVNNTPPSVGGLSVSSSISENGTATLIGQVVDAGTRDTFTLTVDWQDGTAVEVYALGTESVSEAGFVWDPTFRMFSIQHTVLDDDPTGTPQDALTVALTLTDDDTGQGTASAVLLIENVAPTVDGLTLDVDEVDENGSVTVSGTFSDVGSLDTHEATIDWGDGITSRATLDQTAGTFTASHQYFDDPNGSDTDYTITAFVTDDDGGTGQASTTVSVNNVAPIVGIVELDAQVIDENETVTLTGSFSDIGSLDTHTVTVDWGDGSSSTAVVDPVASTFSATHQYLDDDPSGTPSDAYTITATITDDDGGTGAATASVAVNNVAPEAGVLNLDTTMIDENGSVTLTGSFSDASSLDTHTVSIDWGDGSSSQAVVDAVGRTFTATHQYLDDTPSETDFDRYTIQATVSDDDGGVATAQTDVTVNNVAPVTDPLTLDAAAIVEGGSVTVSGSFSDVGILDTHEVTIDWGDGQTSEATVDQSAGTFSATHSYQDDVPSGTASDSYTITATVVDDDGGSHASSATVTVDNAAPVSGPIILGSVTLDENDTLDITGSFTDAGMFDTHEVTVDWGDGTSSSAVVDAATRTFSASHQYLDNADVTITATVTDDDGESSSSAASFTITNLAPTVTSLVLDAQVVDEDGTVTLTGTFADAGSLDTHEATIEWGDGSSSEAVVDQASGTFTAVHRYLDDDPSATAADDVTITATVTDNDGDSVSASTQVTITNVDPSIASLSLDATVIDENGSIKLTGTFTDVSSLDTHEVTIDWGDGTRSPALVDAASGSFSADHQYLDDTPSGTTTDPFTISATVSDDDGGSVTATTSVTVNNLAPSVGTLTLDAASIDEGGSVTVGGTFADIGVSDTHVVTIEWGDGTTSQADVDQAGRSFTATHQYVDDTPSDTASDSYTIVATVTDDDDGVGTNETSIVVNNVDPEATTLVLGSPTIDETGTLSVTGSFTDIGAGDTHEVVVDWGDGTSSVADLSLSTKTFAASHTYLDNANYTVTATVTDDDGGSDSASAVVTVVNAKPVVDSLVLDVQTVDENGFVTVTGSFSDDGLLDAHTATITWGDGTTSDAVVDADSRTFTATHQYLDDMPDGTADDVYPIVATVVDDDGGVGISTALVTVANIAPEFDAGADTTLLPDVTGEFVRTIDFNDAGSLDVHTVTVDYGDGTPTDTVVLPVGTRAFDLGHVYTADGVFTPQVTISDDDLGTASDAFTVTVILNTPPEAVAGSYVVDETDALSLTLDGSGSSDEQQAASTLLYAWDLDGDGVFGEVGAEAARGDETGIAPVFTALNLDGPDQFVIGLEVTDSFGEVDTTTGTIDIANVAPEITGLQVEEVPVDGSVPAGDDDDDDDDDDDGDAIDTQTSVTAVFSDASSADTHSAEIDWGDGTVESVDVVQGAGSGSVNGLHDYAEGGIYTVGLTVTDDDGGSTVETTTVQVTGVGVQDGVLNIIGTDGSDDVDIKRKSGNRIEVKADFLDGNNKVTFDLDEVSVDRIAINLRSGDNDYKVDDDLDIPVEIVGVNGQAAGVVVRDGVLEITGTEGDDDVDVKEKSGNRIEVKAGFILTNNGKLTFDRDEVDIDRIRLDLGQGKNEYDIDDDIDIPVEIAGADGGSAGVFVDAGVLKIIGTDGRDDVKLKQKGGNRIEVKADFIVANNNKITFDLDDVGIVGIDVSLGGDHDEIDVDSDIELPVTVDLGDGQHPASPNDDDDDDEDDDRDKPAVLPAMLATVLSSEKGWHHADDVESRVVIGDSGELEKAEKARRFVSWDGFLAAD